MIEVRNGLFETNSSSTHAIVVSLEKFPTKLRPVDLYTPWDNSLEFGRETYRLLDTWDLKLGYIYIVMLEIDDAWNSNPKTIEKPKVDLVKFKATVEKLFAEVTEGMTDGRNYTPWNTTPSEMFKVLEFMHTNPGKEPDFEYSDYYDEIIKDGIYVDHIGEFMFMSFDDRRYDYPCVDLIEKLQDSEDYLKSFLFSDESYITIGGDEYRGYNLKTLGFEYDYRDKEDWKRRVQEYKKTHDVYFKGN